MLMAAILFIDFIEGILKGNFINMLAGIDFYNATILTD
jgi:hypothetical protein